MTWAIIVGPALGLAGLIFGVVARRKQTSAETDLAVSQAKHEDAETESIVVRTVREALAEVRQLSHEKDQQLRDMRTDMTALRGRVDGLTSAIHSAQVALAAHGQWDLLIYAEVRKTSPDFPEPPPLARLMILEEE